MKKFISLSLVLALVLVFAAGCASTDETNDNGNTSDSGFAGTINVVSREDGSGTRGAFIEIVGVLEKDSSGNEMDLTYEEAIIQNSTDGVMTTVAGDKYSVGYISLGSLNDTVKALKVDGVEATAENVQEGSYKIARPFNIAYKEGLNSLGTDFISFILSSQGQDIVVGEGYVQVSNDLPEYTPSNEEGSLVIAGSTSVTPVMEKLAEAYEELNPDVTIEIQATGSSAGMQSAIEGSADIGMASRELKDSEKESLAYEAMAIDGIAVIVNNENIIDDVSIDDIKSIYIGETTDWEDLQN